MPTQDFKGTINGFTISQDLTAGAGPTFDHIHLTSGQIAFPAIHVASADPNTLDDYEEGTWTPNVGGDTTYSVQTGKYTKIGRLVTATFNMTITLLGTGSATILSGLPFATTNEVAVNIGYFASLAVTTIHIAGYAGAGGSTIRIIGLSAAANTANDSIAVFGNSAVIAGSLTYSV